MWFDITISDPNGDEMMVSVMYYYRNGGGGSGYYIGPYTNGTISVSHFFARPGPMYILAYCVDEHGAQGPETRYDFRVVRVK